MRTTVELVCAEGHRCEAGEVMVLALSARYDTLADAAAHTINTFHAWLDNPSVSVEDAIDHLRATLEAHP